MGENGVSQTRREGAGMGRYGPHYSPASVVSSVSDDRGGGWADTAHATELQLADMKGEGMRIYDGNIGTEIRARTRSADRIFLSSILLSRLRALFVALVVLCSVGRIGPSPPDRPVRTRQVSGFRFSLKPPWQSMGDEFCRGVHGQRGWGRGGLSTEVTDVHRWSRRKRFYPSWSPQSSVRIGDLCG